jgi:hypothetical protein
MLSRFLFPGICLLAAMARIAPAQDLETSDQAGGTTPPLPALTTEDKEDKGGPPPLPGQQAHYYVEENGAPVGPLTLTQILQLIQAGQMNRTDLVWKAPLVNWVMADSITELQELFAQVQPPPIPLEARIKNYLTGIWESQIQNPSTGTTQKWTTRYNADGSFAGTQTMGMGGIPPVTVPLQGTWQVGAISEHRFSLTLNITGQHAPTTSMMRILDRNTIEDEHRGYRAYRMDQ